MGRDLTLRHWAGVTLLLGLIGAALFFIITAPSVFHAVRGRDEVLPSGFVANAERGARLFWAGGCASCHQSPRAAGQAEPSPGLQLGGGLRLNSPFGTFIVPNLSSHPQDGIGSWSFESFARAMREGVLPDQRHAFPAFPYTAYQRMTMTDLADLFAFLKTVPAVSGRQPDHALAFPFHIRRAVGVWKWIYLDGKAFVARTDQSPVWNQGAYLVNALSHCADCHSPRTILGGIEESRRFAGGPSLEARSSPDGKTGRVPNLTSSSDGLGAWSVEDIEAFLKSGFTPDFDSVGGSMAEVITNMGHVSDADRQAMAVYLKSLPPVPQQP